MKNILRRIQFVCLVIMAVSIVIAAFVPAMYYVTASAMLLTAIAAIAEPNEQAACPRIFSKAYRAKHHAE